jgi:hypothetical protein
MHLHLFLFDGSPTKRSGMLLISLVGTLERLWSFDGQCFLQLKSSRAKHKTSTMTIVK